MFTHERKKRRLKSGIAAVAAFTFGFLVSACGSASVGGSVSMDALSLKGAPTGFSTEASLGATVGGAQDMSYARAAIERGEVPQPESILTEGLLSEHDLRLEGEPADKLLSLNLGAGMLREKSGKAHYLVQIGMTSNLDPATFKRRPLNMSLVVDVSGSMQGEKIAAARRAAHHLVKQLDKRDYFSLVAFNHDSDVEISSTRVYDSEREDIEEEIDDLRADGSTNMDEGMRDGYDEILDRVGELKGYEHRLILLTDALPNTGRSSTSDFLSLAERMADKGIGLTAFGIGVDFGVELATSISNLRGGNYRYLADPTELPKIFEEDFQMLATPLAYEFKLAAEAAPGFRITGMHGIPGWKEGDLRAEAEVATVFASKNAGAIAVELERTVAGDATGTSGAELLRVALSYTEVTGQKQSELKGATLPVGSEQGTAYFSHQGVAKTATLAFAAQGMRRACRDFHGGNPRIALAHLSGIPELLEKAASETNTASIRSEAALVRKLTSNISRHTSTYPLPEAEKREPVREKEWQPEPLPKNAGLGPSPVRW